MTPSKKKESKQKITREISIDHIARIEGKAGIEVTYDGSQVELVRVNVFEGPRYFEAITKGKPIEEATAVFPRICSFCAAAHKVTALQAAENAIGLKPTEQTRALRELLYTGDYIESHALHLFLLALPDFLGYPDAFSMAEDHPDVVNAAIALKDIGADIQNVIGSRYIHQENAILGGFGKIPSKQSLETLARRLRMLQCEAEEALEQLVSYPNWPEVDAKRTHLALEPHDGSYTMLGDTIKASDGNEFKVDAYQVRMAEEVVPYSFAKHGTYSFNPFMTGAISRFSLFGHGISARAAELAETYASHLDPKNPMSNNFAQSVELVHFVHRAEKIAEDLASDLKPYEKRIEPKVTKGGKGVAITEAPRGLLAYTLEVDKNAKVVSADIITPTVMFLPMMETDLRRMAEGLVSDGMKEPTEIGNKLETVVRAYDPCISCSVHVADVR
ncbi:MAG: Ni/Fe hydrogenase subunit alpha [Candidatus Thorarchaeota archaeon]